MEMPSSNTSSPSSASSYSFAADWLSTEEYHTILTTVDPERTCSLPPVRPSPGEIYIFQAGDSKSLTDWRTDQHRWRCVGIEHLPSAEPLITCLYYRAIEGKRFYRGFYRRAYILFDDKKLCSDVTLIHYTTKDHFDVKHVTTTETPIKDRIKESPQRMHTQLDNEDSPAMYLPVLAPRDKIQVINTKEIIRRIIPTHNDYYDLYSLSAELNHFVKSCVVLPRFCVILFSEETLEHFKNLNYINALYYDTAFELEDFFVSFVTFKHEDFEEGPVIPLAYMIHDENSTEAHESFFRLLVESCPKIKRDQIPIIVTDTEDVILEAITELLPESSHFKCWNHILQQIQNWVDTQEMSEKGDYGMYGEHVKKLLENNSEEEFLQMYNTMSEQWAKTGPFKHYFDEHIFDDVIQNGKWVLQAHGLYTPNSGSAMKPDERFNTVLKNCVDKKVPLLVLALTLYQLDLHYQREVLRGYRDIGNYKRKPHVAKGLLENTEIPELDFSIEQLPYMFADLQDSLMDYSSAQESLSEENPTAETKSDNASCTEYVSDAEMWRLQVGRVRLQIPGLFIITPPDSKEFFVRLYPEETCSCDAKTYCWHIEAARLSIGHSPKLLT